MDIDEVDIDEKDICWGKQQPHTVQTPRHTPASAIRWRAARSSTPAAARLQPNTAQQGA